MKKFIKNNAFFFISCCIFLPLFIINQIPAAARALSFINEWYTLIAGKIVSLLPFSLLSIFVLILPLILAALIIFFIKSKRKWKFALSLAGVIMVMLSLFILSMGLGYSRQSVYASLQIDTTEPSNETVENAYDYYVGRLNDIAQRVNFSQEDNGLAPPFSFKEMEEMLRQEYQRQNYEFLYAYSPTAKMYFPSGVLNYTGITGIYMGYIGEANVAANIPWKDLITTCAHELAHAKGVLNEGEANFMAFLLCINSQNDYFKYAGYSYAVGNLLNSLYSSMSAEDYAAKKALIDEKALFAYRNSNEFFLSFEGVISDLSGMFNDIYTKLNGMPQGTKTYSLASKGIIGYYIKYYD